jgi:hypothetical protein
VVGRDEAPQEPGGEGLEADDVAHRRLGRQGPVLDPERPLVPGAGDAVAPDDTPEPPPVGRPAVVELPDLVGEGLTGARLEPLAAEGRDEVVRDDPVDDGRRGLDVPRDAHLRRRGVVDGLLEGGDAEFVGGFLDQAGRVVDTLVEVRWQERRVGREGQYGAERPDGGVVVVGKRRRGRDLEVWLDRGGQRLEQDRREGAVDAGNREGNLAAGPPADVVVDGAIARVGPHVLGEDEVVDAVVGAQVRGRALAGRHRPHGVEDEFQAVLPCGRPRLVEPGLDGPGLPRQPVAAEDVRLGVDLRVVEAEFLRRAGLEDRRRQRRQARRVAAGAARAGPGRCRPGVGFAGTGSGFDGIGPGVARPGLGRASHATCRSRSGHRPGRPLDRVDLHLQADGEVVVVQPTLGDVLAEPLGLVGDAGLEGLDRLGRQRPGDEVHVLAHVSPTAPRGRR